MLEDYDVILTVDNLYGRLFRADTYFYLDGEDDPDHEVKRIARNINFTQVALKRTKTRA